jgi:hypothetical protein
MSEPGEQPQQRSILERFRNAKETPGVSKAELEREFVRLTDRGDDQAKKGLADIFDL